MDDLTKKMLVIKIIEWAQNNSIDIKELNKNLIITALKQKK